MPKTTSFSRRALLALACATAIGGFMGPLDATAQPAYPTKPVRLIVPFPPGGGTDILARVIGAKLTEALGQPVVVENKPGAGGNIGVDLVAKSAPDGYNMVIGQTSNLAVNPTLYPDLPYDPQKDLAPISLVADAPLVLVVAANSPFKTLGDVINAAKGKPEDVTFASPGNGTVSASQRRTSSEGREREVPAHPLQGRIAGPDRPHGRTGPDLHVVDPDRAGPDQGRQAARPCGDLDQACPGPARRADRRGVGLSRLRDRAPGSASS